jgi:hypothetical protein
MGTVTMVSLFNLLSIEKVLVEEEVDLVGDILHEVIVISALVAHTG